MSVKDFPLVAFYVPPELLAQADLLAALERCSRSELLRRLIADAVERLPHDILIDEQKNSTSDR